MGSPGFEVLLIYEKMFKTVLKRKTLQFNVNGRVFQLCLAMFFLFTFTLLLFPGETLNITQYILISEYTTFMGQVCGCDVSSRLAHVAYNNYFYLFILYLLYLFSCEQHFKGHI